MKTVLKHAMYFLVTAFIFWGVFYIADVEEIEDMVLVGGLMIFLYAIGYIRGMVEA